MKKHLAKIISFVLVLSVLSGIPVFAADMSNPSVSTEEKVQALVQERIKQVIHNFERKDPGYLEAYTNYLTDYYTLAVATQSGVSLQRASHRLDNGGTAKYSTTDASGDKFDVVIIMLDKADSYDYLLENWSPGRYTVSDAIVTALGYVPVVGGAFGTVYSIVEGVIGFSSKTDWEKIQAADGYIMLETVVARDYPGSGIPVLMGWDDHPYYVPYSSLPSSISIDVEEFPS